MRWHTFENLSKVTRRAIFDFRSRVKQGIFRIFLKNIASLLRHFTPLDGRYPVHGCCATALLKIFAVYCKNLYQDTRGKF